MAAAVAPIFHRSDEWARTDRLVAHLRRIGLEPFGRRLAREHCVSLEDILSPKRCASVSRARRHLAAVLRWTLAESYPDIGRLLGLDHTTVINAEREWGKEVETMLGEPGEWTRLARSKR